MTFSPQHRVARLLTRLATALAVLVALTPVSLYAVVSYYRYIGMLDSNLRLQAIAVEHVIQQQPDQWQLNPARLEAGFQRYVIPGEHFRIVDSSGAVIVTIGQRPDWPSLVRSHPVHDFGRVVGRLEAELPVADTLFCGLALFALSLLAAWLIHGPLRQLPLAALASAEADLRRRDRYQRTLLDNFPFVIWLKDTDGRYLAVNRAFAESIGEHDVNALVGKTDFDLFAHDLAERFCASDRAQLVSLRQTNVEEELPVGGVQVWHETYKAVVIGDHAEVLGTVGFTRDISVRKQAEAELERYRHSLEALVDERTVDLRRAHQDLLDTQLAMDKVGIGIRRVDNATRRVVYANRYAAEMLGYSVGEMVGMHISELDPQVALDSLDDLLRHQGQAQFESLSLTRDGRQIPVEISLHYSAACAAAPAQTIAFVTDISQRKKTLMQLQESEERFRQAFVHAPFGIAVVAIDGRVREANTALCRMLGRAADEINGCAFEQFFADDATTRNGDPPLSLLAGISSSLTRERVGVRRDGQRLALSCTLSLVCDANDRPLNFIAQVEDISERKQLQLRDLAAGILVAQERERERLSHELHDEIGQSLTALKIALKRAQLSSADPARIASSLGDGQRMLEQLMDEVRSIAYRLRPAELDQLGLAAALRSHLDKTIRPLGQKVALVENIGEARLPLNLELCCFRVVQEALTNALRHSQADSLQVTLTLDDAALRVAVKDGGVGFDLGRHYSSHERHASLGLIGMRERVSANGGQLQILSSPGAGTEVVATFALSVLSKESP